MNRAFFVFLIAIIACGLALSGTALADTGKMYDYRDTTLDNGLRVLTLEDHACPIVAVHLWYHVGSKDERPERQGFAHMFEHMMFRGTDRLGKTDHFDYIHRTGGDCNAYTAFDQTVYIQTLPANQLELALWLEAERMGFLRIDQTNFDTERKVVEEERRVGLNRPYGTLPEKALAGIFKVHPYGWSPIGKISHLRASPAQDLRDFWMRYYIPNNATLVIVGDIKHDEAQKMAKKYFGWMPREADPPRVTVQEPMPKEAKEITLSEDNAPAPIVAIGWRTVPARHDDAIPLELLGLIFGQGNSSRLHRKLVAETQLAAVAVAGTFSLEQEGFFAAGAVLSPVGGDTKKAKEALEKELERLRTEPVSDKELTKAKNFTLAQQITTNFTVENKATLLGTAAVLEGDVSRVNRRLDAIRKVTADDLLRVAKTYLPPNRSFTFVVERNLLGSMLGKRSTEITKEMESPITAKPETNPPPPGKAGLRRPADFPDKPPSAGLLEPRSPYTPSRHKLDNGLKVIVVPKRNVPYVTIELGLLAGAWTETKPGTASMALSMLTKGTKKHSEKELAEELENYAIDLGGNATLDTSTVTAGCLTEHLERALNLMAETVETPTFPAAEFDKLRKQVRTGLAVSSAQPQYKADREMRRQLFGSHPYSRTASGEPEDLDTLKADDLAPWWTTHARPDQATLIFAGDIDADRALELTKKAFGTWQASGSKTEDQLPLVPPAAGTHIYLVDYPGVQSQIRIAQVSIKRDHSDYPTARVVSDYFGGAFGARLNEAIRVKKGLTYGARGGYNASRFAGQFAMSTFSKTETTAEAVQAVLDEFNRLLKEPPSEKELKDTKSYSTGSFARDRQTPQQVAGQLWLIESEGLPEDYFERTLEKVSQTDAAGCQQLVRETLNPSKLVIVVVGSAAKIQKDLEKIAPVTLVKPGGASK
ncbi:MAG TPA: pitrilysin family protein [Gemmataceae bacterium]|nr:pitrilysin family protein [Gemmataceae bacterium]